MANCIKCGCTEIEIKDKGPHRGEFCSGCGVWIRWVSKPIKDFVWPVGAKHKGKKLVEIIQKDRPYLEWASNNMQGKLAKVAREALETL